MARIEVFLDSYFSYYMSFTLVSKLLINGQIRLFVHFIKYDPSYIYIYIYFWGRYVPFCASEWRRVIHVPTTLSCDPFY